MSFIDSSWPKPPYLKRVSSHERFMKLKKIKQNPIFFKNKYDNIQIDNNISFKDNNISFKDNDTQIMNYTNTIIPRGPIKYYSDQLTVCIIFWCIMLKGLKNYLFKGTYQNGTRY